MALKTLWKDETAQRVITRSDAPSDQTRALLRNTIWGSRALKYRIMDIDQKLRRLRDPSFMVLVEAGQELSVIVLDHCHKHVAGQICGVYHFVMASTRPERQNTGLAGFLLDHVREYCIATVGRPGLGFAYVEATTEFSLKLSDRIGSAVSADIPLTLFTRLMPHPDPNVGPLRPDEAPDVVGQLSDLYADHELLDFETSY
ncbi:MAG: hypothetical protein P8Y96_13940 [Desulfuromonadales bacterium]